VAVLTEGGRRRRRFSKMWQPQRWIPVARRTEGKRKRRRRQQRDFSSLDGVTRTKGGCGSDRPFKQGRDGVKQGGSDMSSHEERGGGSDTGSDGTTHVGSAGSNDLGVAASGHAGVWVARAGEMPP
jgi:hypothetical protein